MRIPDGLEPLLDYGVLEEVIRPLMSGKEAQVYLVVSNGQVCVAKVYKEAQNRTFKNRADYTEGRTTRNSRDQRAMSKRSKHGRAQDEAAWRSTEVDMIHRLHTAGVRVPVPHHFVEGVLLMEMVKDAEGNPAPRLGDLRFTPEEARAMFDRLVREVVRMLCAGVVHGDLSDFNVLVGADGPVIIDFPQSVDTARNPNARRLLLRDVENLHEFHRRWVPGARRLPLAEEMWELHEANLLTPETRLEGRHRGRDRGPVNTDSVLSLIRDANDDERKRRQVMGLKGGEAIPDAEPEKPAPPPPVSRYAQKMAQRRAELAANPPPAPVAPPPRPPFARPNAPTPPPQAQRPADPRGPRPPQQQGQGPRPQGHPGQRQPQPGQGPRPQGPRPPGQPGQFGQGPRPGEQPRPPRPQQGPGPRPPQPQPQHGPSGQGQRPQGQPAPHHGQGPRPQGQPGQQHGQGPRPPGQPGQQHSQGPRPQGQPGQQHGQGPRPPHPQHPPQGQHQAPPHPRGPRPPGQPQAQGPRPPPQQGAPRPPYGQGPFSSAPAAPSPTSPDEGGGFEGARRRRRRPEPVGAFTDRPPAPARPESGQSPPRDREPRPSNAPRDVTTRQTGGRGDTSAPRTVEVIVRNERNDRKR